MMFRMLIDTCVWLDLAKDPKQVPVLGVVEELLRRGMLSLIVPRSTSSGETENASLRRVVRASRHTSGL